MTNSPFQLFAWRYASRSLWRHKRRTAIIIGTVALSVTVSIVGTRYSKAVLKIWQDGAINNGAGHAQVHRLGYLDHPDVVKEELSFKVGDSTQQLLESDPAIFQISRRLLFEGILSNAGKSVYIFARAVDAESELRVSPGIFGPGTGLGTFVTADNEAGIVIGKGLADTLGLKVGDEASMMSHTVKGGVNGTDLRVIGIVDPPLVSISKRLLYMNLVAGQKAIHLPGGYTEIAIRLKDGNEAEPWVKATGPKMQKLGLDLRGWWQVDPVIREVERIWDSVIGVICFLLFVSAGISVLNIVYMLVAERTVEIGTLMAIGARPRDIRRLFTLEAVIIGAVGAAVGALIGNLILLGMDAVGVPFDSPFGAGTLIVHPKMHILVTVVIGVIGVVICYLSALAPSHKASKIQPVVAFRGQMT